MVGKLIKHELIAIGRVLAFIAIAAFLFSILSRFSMHASNENGTLYIIMISFFTMTILALDIAAWALCFVRFAKPLFSGEGYMTFSLPATPSQIIWSKMIATFISMIFAAIISIVCLLIIFSGFDSYIWKDIAYFFGGFFEQLFSFASSSPLMIIEIVLLGIVSLPMTLLFSYLLLSLGQLFTKSRKRWTVLLFFGSGFVINLLSSYVFNPILMATSQNVSPHLSVWIMIIFYAAVDVGCFFGVRYILSHKLNLLT